MKKILSLAISLAIIFGCAGIGAFAAEASADIYVTVADKGKIVVTYEEISVTDIDGDGKLTVNDALYAAHEAEYNGGAAAGYSSYIHKDYGLSLGKLWGDTSGNFGYYLNNASCWSLTDAVKNGDSLYAFVYSDSKYYSDVYCFFNENSVNAAAGDEITLTLSGAGYDANWNPVTVPIVGATITVNGKTTDIKTDSNGKATVTAQAGTSVISAVSEKQILVPPICVVEAESVIVSLIKTIFEWFLNIINTVIGMFS